MRPLLKLAAFLGVILFLPICAQAQSGVGYMGGNLISRVTPNCVVYATAGGTGDAITVPLLVNPATPCLPTQTLLALTVTASNTTTAPTLKAYGYPAQTIIQGSGAAVAIGQLAIGSVALLMNDGTNWRIITGGAGSGTVTSVGLSVPASSLFGVTGSPVTGIGTLGLTTTGSSGGIAYFSSTSQLNSSPTLIANDALIGGGPGSPPGDVNGGTGCVLAWSLATNPPTCSQTPTLGASGILGSISLGNATSGLLTLEPVTGALGTVTASLPANSGVIAETNYAQTWSATQTYDTADLIFLNSGGGATTLAGASSASNFTATFPANTGSVGELNYNQTWSGIQTFEQVYSTSTQQSGTTYTFAATDCGTEVIFTSGTAVTATIPASIVPAAGTNCYIAVNQSGAAKVSVNGSAVTPATLVSPYSYTGTSGTAGSEIALRLTTIGGTATATLMGDGS